MPTRKPQLPTPAAPGGVYRPVVVHEGIAYVSGQLPRQDNVVRVTGIVGQSVDVETAREGARLCALQCLAALEKALGGLGRVVRLLKVTGYVACSPEFDGQPHVIDAASQVFVEHLGTRGEHARAAIGVAALPRGAAVEIEVMAAVER